MPAYQYTRLGRSAGDRTPLRSKAWRASLLISSAERNWRVALSHERDSACRRQSAGSSASDAIAARCKSTSNTPVTPACTTSKGPVTGYAAMGKPQAVRAVGGANGRNPLAIVVPCHRVIGAGGNLTGYASGVDRKSWLLEHEQK